MKEWIDWSSGRCVEQEVIVPMSQLRELLVTDVHLASEVHRLWVKDIAAEGQVQVLQGCAVQRQRLDGAVSDEPAVRHVHPSELPTPLRDGY